MSDINETSLLRAMRSGPASVADVSKSVDAEKEDVEAALEDLRLRQLAEPDDATSTAKTPRWRLTQLGMNSADARD